LTVRGAVDVATEGLARDADGARSMRAHRVSSRAAFAARQWIGERLSFQALGAFACDGTAAYATPTCDTTSPAGRAGVAWTDDAFSAFANVGRYERVPTLGELYGMGALVRGNAALAPESGLSFDAGLRSEGASHAWGGAFAFARSSEDLIGFVRSSEGYVMPRNVARARTLGVEAQGGVAFLSLFSAEISATFLDARDTTPGRLVVNDVLPFQSRLVVTPRVAAERKGLAWGAFAHARAELRFTYQSSRYADAAGLAVIPAQSSLDAELLLATRDDRVAVRARGVDLADSRRVDIVGYPLPGRSFYLSLEARW
jgi:iron complex outermembrane receptor protein